MKYLGFPLPELRLSTPFVRRDAEKIRDTEFLEEYGIPNLKNVKIATKKIHNYKSCEPHMLLLN